MDNLSIFIIDDHKLIRQAVKFFLDHEPGCTVSGDAGGIEEALPAIKAHPPDIVLMDINMSPVSGFEATEQLLREFPEVRVIGFSMYAQPAYARKMMQTGAMGYVTKNSPKEELVRAVKEVATGKKYICEEVKNTISEQVLEQDDRSGNLNALTERELEIIGLIRKGLSSREIAADLKISLKTVEVHRHNILKKLKLKNVASLVNYINRNATFI